MDTIIDVLMRRDDMPRDEAEELIRGAKADLDEVIENGGNILDAEDVIKDWFGLEPDYLMELL